MQIRTMMIYYFTIQDAKIEKTDTLSISIYLEKWSSHALVVRVQNVQLVWKIGHFL